MRELPIACSLDATALEQRLSEIRAVGQEAFLGVEPGGVVRFRATPAVHHRLERLVAAEAECCPFLGLDLREQAGELRLTISAPEGAEPVAAQLVEAFSG